MTRSALISLAGQPRLADGSPVTIAGKTIAARQADYALAAGCSHVVMLGDGTRPEAAQVRQQVEAAGARFQLVPDAHALLGAVGATDELLVIAPGLVIEREAPRAGAGIYVFPAQVAVEMGFERIDADLAWAGLLVVNGGAVERLAELPRENEPAATLLRIALQARVPMRAVTEEALDDASWQLVSEGDDLTAQDRGWLKRHIVPSGPWAWSRRLADLLIKPWAVPLMTARHAVAGFTASLAAFVIGAVAVSGQGFPVAGFGLVVLATLTAAVLTRIAALRAAPFGAVRGWNHGWLGAAIDAALAGCIVFAIDGPWLQRVFIPAALLGALYATRPDRWKSAGALLGDRGILAVCLMAAALFGAAEPVAMAFVLAVLIIAAVHSARDGLTRN